MKNILYQVYTSRILEIREVEYIKKTDHYYWTKENRRDVLDTKYRKSFDEKQHAINYLRGLITSKIRSAEYVLELNKQELEKFNILFPQV